MQQINLNKKLLIVSTLDSNEPFGAFARPFYLGMYLSKHFELCQLGLNCSAVNYAQSVSIGSRSLNAYIKNIQQCIEEFNPDIVYAQETLPGLAALMALSLKKSHKCRLMFDFHTLSAFEYWTRLPFVSQKFNEFSQFIKTYIAQGTLIFANKPIVSASQSIVDLIPNWYPIKPKQSYCVGNGVTEDLLNANTEFCPEQDPYSHLRPAKIVLVIAPKTFSFPSNDMSVSMTVQVAKHLESHRKDIHFVVIGRDAEEIADRLPSNLTFLGFLPKRSDFVTHIRYADVGLLPFAKEAVAGGARNKALDYFACEKLVVSTPEGLRGLEEFKHQKHLLVSEHSSEAVAKTVLDACTNLDSYQLLAKAAYQLIEEKYSWNAMAEKVAGILEQQAS
jgi:glycosyltransferase involved in cell wall biosynthesis